uniref:Proteasome subunit beta n=1 Tax=Arcella intermedia TaxID=1963864 RepID=A0A6B2LIG4_9EUKA|eukprot:TRINITY_DN28160_c0_g1_i1.p1 TRINITY_DN28160_c0_g1~~TRINITY_DN28160_c0_g1_i1.p1  ORF type:complete len:205 (-),score=26.09 TRINITY_DN28160_c0_g1_i1:48-662(-)
MSIMGYNGGAVIAMAGKNCVAIACDTRFGIQAQTVAFDFPKVFKISNRVFVGLPGLLTDTQTFHENLKFKVNLYELREERPITPKVFSNMCASMLYERRFGPYFIEPIIAGLSEDNTPFISGMDLIGAPVLAEDFVLAGTCSEALFGMAECLWRKDMNPEELFECIGQTLLNAFDRDATSGWGAIVHILTPEGITTKTLKTRQD